VQAYIQRQDRIFCVLFPCFEFITPHIGKRCLFFMLIRYVHNRRGTKSNDMVDLDVSCSRPPFSSKGVCAILFAKLQLQMAYVPW